MKKTLICGLAAAVLVAVAAQVLPDVKRYLRMRCM